MLHKLDYHQEIHPSVVVLDVDDKSIDEFGRWPWPRNLTAEMFQKLELASLVVADMVFSESSTEHDDLALAEVIENNENVILGFFLRGGEREQYGESSYPYIESCALQRVDIVSSFVDLPAVKNAEVNIPLIAESALSCALFTVTADPDGIYRNYPLLYVYQDLILPTLALQAFQFYTDQELAVVLGSNGIEEIQGKNLTIKDMNRLFINFPAQVPKVSARELLTEEVSKEFFKDKIVLVGLSEIGLYDIRPTNLDPYTPGVDIHAAALSNLLNENWYSYKPKLSLALTLITLLLLVFIAKAIEKDLYRWFVYLFLYSLFIFSSTLFLFKTNSAILLFQWLFYCTVCLLLIEGKNFLVIHNRYHSVKSAFSSYVVPEVVESIVEQGIDPEQKGVLKNVTVLFSDIQNFTNLSDSLKPEQVITLLNTVFEPVTENIINNEGMLDKYIGDEVMAMFNAPMDVEDYHDKSVQAGIGIQQCLKDVNKTLFELSLPPVRLSLGIASGPVILGNIGTSLRVNYTAVGNTVNMAARLTSLSKIYGQEILITEDMLNELSEEYRQRFCFVDSIVVKGRSAVTRLYGIEDVNIETNEVLNAAYLRAFSIYERGEFDAASEAFGQLISSYSHNASACMLSRCMKLAETPPEEWNGVFKFDHK